MGGSGGAGFIVDTGTLILGTIAFAVLGVIYIWVRSRRRRRE
jgi:hypothetical protein